MGTGKRRPLLSSAAAMLTLVATAGAGLLAGPAPARAADTVRGLQWYLDPLKIPQAHKLSRGKGVVVAVVDSGVYAAHPDLKGQVLPGKGLSADVAADGRSDPDAQKGHGTGMAGVIAGRGGGVMHELGIAPEAKILPVGLGADDRNADIAAGIRWAADHGADVINVSLANDSLKRELADAIRYALSKDAVVVAGAGNVDQGMVGVQAPASIPGVVAAGGTDRAGGLWTGSATGPELVLAAPGERIIAPAPPTVSPNGYVVNDGTSLSTAIISGVAALVRSRYPDLDAANVVNRLIRTARDEGPSGRDPRFGFGVVDPLAALTRSVPPVSANPLLEAAPPAPTASSSRDSRDDEPMVTFGLAKGAGPAIATALCLLVVVAVVVLLVWLTRRGVRRPAAPTAPGPHPPLGPPPGHRPPGFGPPTGPGQFPGYPPPSGNGPPPGFAPSAGPVPAHPYQPRPVSQPTAPHPYPPPAGPVPPATGPVPPPTGPEQG
ncbi:S8 family serine peptidase [Micromonospora sp. NBC_00898]|uniref:S8 family serine peptidase n=1 Tax=Micromonospora sp. NBC_00898 TaxID=2975981 RepID=UPI0038684DEE|nr:S8 family serine peptidase [Micromonospora sp. NBC_00898]